MPVRLPASVIAGPNLHFDPNGEFESLNVSDQDTTNGDFSYRANDGTVNSAPANVDVTVTFPDKLYDKAEGTSGPDRQLRKDKIKDEGPDSKTVVRLRRTIKSPTDSTPLDPRHLIDLIAASYERVKPIRRKKLVG